MLTALVSRLMILAFGTLYPAYASYKAVRTKDVKEYVKWMMYWIVFALFTFAETFTDVLFSFWFPFYYEIKVAIVFWLLSPATKGSSYLYRNFVHPAFQQRESEIDEMLNKAKEKGYSTVLSIGSKSMSYATNVILQTAMKRGGGIMEHLRKSYSLTDLSPQPKDVADAPEHMDRLRAPPRGRRQLGGSTVNMSFAEVDVDIRQNNIHNEMLGDVRSTEDISSGYSSTDQLYTEGVLTRSSSVSSARLRGRGRPATRRAVPLPEESEDSDTDQWNECSSVITGVTQTPTPQSIPSGANLEYMTSQTSNSVSGYQSSEHVSNITETVEDKITKPEFPSNVVETVENLVNLETNIKLLSVEPNDVIKELNTCHVINLEAKKSSSQCSISSLNSDKSQDSERKGKYNKPLAPKPPSLEPSKDNFNVDKIKLTETINEVKTSKDDVNVKIDEIKLIETSNEVKAESKEEIKEINLPRTEMRLVTENPSKTKESQDTENLLHKIYIVASSSSTLPRTSKRTTRKKTQ